MNNPYNIYNQNVPFIQHTDWASVAKQWATLRADVNIPHSIPELHNFHNIPPPPPPSPPMDHNLTFKSNSYDNYQSINNQIFNEQEFMNNSNRNIQIHPNMNNPYQNTAYSVFDEKKSSTVKSKCETFDYNHGNRPYEYYDNIEPCKPSVTPMSYTQNMWNLPPPDHPDIVRSNYKTEQFSQPDPIPQPKLFPINAADFQTTLPATSIPPTFFLNKNTPITKPIESKIYIESRFDTDFVAAKPNKGLPAWIIDDMKKMKEKERKQTYHSMDIYKDNPINSKRDEEGDIVMEDVSREVHGDGKLSGKNVTKHPLDNSITETDISDVSPHDDDPSIGKIDYSSKSLMELIEMFDESEIEAIKMSVIRDSLTDVMKEITDDMIFSIVKSTFSRELTKGKKTHKHKGKNNALDSPAIKQKPEVMCQLLGLDAYESDNDDDDNEIKKVESGSNKSDNASRKKWCKNKQSDINPEFDIKLTSVKSSSKEKHESNHKDKGTGSSETSSKRKHRSKSRDNGRSKDKRKSHKKSKKHSDTSEHRDHHREKSSSSRKKTNKERSRS